MNLRVAAGALAALLSFTAHAAPSFYGFAGGAFIQGPQNSGSAIPNVVGQATSGAAATVLTGAGFVLGVVTTKCSVATLNQVIEQDPTAGTLAVGGTAVNVATSTAVACVPRGGSGLRLRGLRMRGL